MINTNGIKYNPPKWMDMQVLENWIHGSTVIDENDDIDNGCYYIATKKHSTFMILRFFLINEVVNTSVDFVSHSDIDMMQKIFNKISKVIL